MRIFAWKIAARRNMYRFLTLGSIGLVGAFGTGAVLGQVLLVENEGSGNISSYTLSGTPINPSLIPGASLPLVQTTDGAGHLFVCDYDANGSVSEYSTAGTLIAKNIITGVYYGLTMAADAGGHLFIGGGTRANYFLNEYNFSGSLLASFKPPTDLYEILDNGQGLLYVGLDGGPISLYSSSSQLLNPSLIPGVNTYGMALDGSGDLFVADIARNTVGEYTTSGAAINPSLIPLSSGLIDSVALDGLGHIFVANSWNNTVGEYTTSGATINAALITGLNAPADLLVVPEPSSAVLWLAAGCFSIFSISTNRRFTSPGLTPFGI